MSVVIEKREHQNTIPLPGNDATPPPLSRALQRSFRILKRRRFRWKLATAFEDVVAGFKGRISLRDRERYASVQLGTMHSVRI